MPAVGYEHPVIGYLVFCGIKFAGYSLAAASMAKIYKKKSINVPIVGAVRTLIGMGVGAAWFLIFREVTKPLYPSYGNPLAFYGSYVGVLFLLRLMEWWALIVLFFDKRVLYPRLDWKTVFAATAWSFFLDLPASLGFCVTGGIVVC